MKVSAMLAASCLRTLALALSAQQQNGNLRHQRRCRPGNLPAETQVVIETVTVQGQER